MGQQQLDTRDRSQQTPHEMERLSLPDGHHGKWARSNFRPALTCAAFLVLATLAFGSPAHMRRGHDPRPYRPSRSSRNRSVAMTEVSEPARRACLEANRPAVPTPGDEPCPAAPARLPTTRPLP